MTQLELWNDQPESWQRQMERSAVRIAFGEEPRENDTVVILSSWEDATESWFCGEGTCYNDGRDASFWFTVRWSGFWNNPDKPWQSSRPFQRNKTFEGREAVEFWQKLMKTGSE